MSKKLSPAQVDFLKRRQFAHVATTNPDGSPQVTALWVDTDGEAVLINTAKGRVKHRNLLRDPRISISIVDSENPYSSLTVSGRAEFVDEGAVDHIRSLQQKYHGNRDFHLGPGEERVIIRVLPERTGGSVS
ncbi:MAG: PPOX class F420-dependent oxidoreductase [Candidatus Dormibacteraeota bacterium]|nr:PPOX class F420-dependent oxidoreductase [Candidatus Dormibacteraeota bacterium]